MKRLRAESAEVSEENGERKKRKISMGYSDGSSESSEGSVVTDDWTTLTQDKLEVSSRQQMKLRKVYINDIKQHFEKPNGHLIIKPGDIIGSKCNITNIPTLFWDYKELIPLFPPPQIK